jgi:hypothetical protein
MLRLVAEPWQVSGERWVPLGEALIRGGRGQLATVFPDRVRGLARRAAVDYAPLLGRVMAHELGHLLLGVSTHSATGLMRGNWTHHDVRRQRDDEWLFAADDVLAILRRFDGSAPPPLVACASERC